MLSIGRIIPSFHRFLQFQPASDTKGLQEKRAEFLGFIKEFTQAMDPKGPYFLGADPCLTDFILAPWAVRFWLFDHFKGGLGIPEGGEDAKVWARFKTWVDAMEGRKSFRETTSDREHYLPIYQRYADDEAQSEMAKASRTGRGVP